MIASSSCFPGAFEPIRFPDDFIWSEGVAAIRNELIQDVKLPFGNRFGPSGFKTATGECLSLPLMDGGIYDNQGISNAIEADRTVDDKDKPIIDMFLICDTSARDEDMLRWPKPDTTAGWFSLETVYWVAVAVFFVSLISLGFLIYYLATSVDTRSISWLQIAFQYVVPILLFVGVILGLIWAYRLFSKNKDIEVSGARFRLWPIAKRLTLPDLIDMVKLRVASLSTMAGDVFMKRIRQLQFNNAMECSTRKDKIAFDLIYALNVNDKERRKLLRLDRTLTPSDAMKDVAACAARVPTTLWFPQNDTLNLLDENVDPEVRKCKEQYRDEEKLLIACAQCTTCFSLLQFLWKRWMLDRTKPRPNDPASPYNACYLKLRSIWDQLKVDPFHYVDRDRTGAP